MPTAVTGPPHTRSRASHWLATAAALGAIAGLAALLQPSGATASDRGPASDPDPSVAAPDPAAADLPLDCGPHGVAVSYTAEGDLDGDGRPETVAAVHCDAGGGTPPSGVYLLTATGPEGAPEVAETLVDPADGMVVEAMGLTDGRLTVGLVGYSGPDVPRSTPDLRGEAAWRWTDGGLVKERTATGPAATV